MIIHITLKYKKTNRIVQNKLACRINEGEEYMVAQEMLNYFARENNINPVNLKYEIEEK